MSHPPMPDADELACLDELIADLSPQADHLLPFLHRVQERLGHVSPAAMRFAAHAFNLSRADVYGVVTFYGDFRETPVGDTVVQLCMAEACQAVGARALAAHAEQRLGVPLGSSTADGTHHLEAVYCLGNCALGPSMRVKDAVHGRVTPGRFDTLLQLPATNRSRS
ncbi:NAD(P)H-dependent oxidoreductase subunit E [Gemmatimonas sp.]|uniref:NADH-quinone oxidoreductase subunit NuoE family protein n=1 Tax=Gemmatimonas sp. TaxID=1962908 RepID=UPI00391FAE57